MENEKAKILVVDDERDITETLKHFFCLKGYEAIGAFSGEEALSILEKEKADLILLDIMMPGLKGTEVARIIKDKYPSLKLIILTAYPEEGERLARDTVLEGLFIKPISVQELYNKLSEVLKQKEISILDSKSKQGIRARVLLIKAKLLFIEPSPTIYNFLSAHFRGLFNKGENYEVDVADNEDTIEGKLLLFNPDIIAVNALFFREYDRDILSKILEKNLYPREIIIYNIGDITDLKNTELQRLTKTIEISCLKKGLLEIRWIEI